MRSSNLLLTIFSSVFAAFVVAIGILFILLPFNSAFRASLAQFILTQSLIEQLIGIALLAMGAAILYGLFLGQRRHYYHIATEQGIVAVDEAVIQSYLDHYWQKAFPGQNVTSKVSIERNEIAIMADLPSTPFEEQRQILYHLEADLKELFSTTLKYDQPLTLSISFPS